MGFGFFYEVEFSRFDFRSLLYDFFAWGGGRGVEFLGSGFVVTLFFIFRNDFSIVIFGSVVSYFGVFR